MKKSSFVAAALLLALPACLVGTSVSTPVCDPISGTVTGTLSNDIIGTWEDDSSPGDTIVFTAPDRVVATTKGSARPGRYTLSGSNLQIAWDDGVTSASEPVFASDVKLGIDRVAVSCIASPPPPFCTAYRRVDCTNATTGK